LQKASDPVVLEKLLVKLSKEVCVRTRPDVRELAAK
jgi:hypothetical protein